MCKRNRGFFATRLKFFFFSTVSPKMLIFQCPNDRRSGVERRSEKSCSASGRRKFAGVAAVKRLKRIAWSCAVALVAPTAVVPLTSSRAADEDASGAAVAHEVSASLDLTTSSSPSDAKSDLAKSAAEAQEPRLREGDEFWQISSRGLGCGVGADELAGLVVHQYDVAKSAWNERDWDAFHAREANRRTVFYVHGNRVHANLAVSNGWQLYDALRASAEQPLRMVVWSWPSEQIRGPLRDVRAKADRAMDDTYRFGAVLARLPADTPVSIVGYSYGARVVTGGLHLAAGGQLDGRSLRDLPPRDPPMQARIILLGAAEHHHWLQPSSAHGRALSQVEHLLNVYNSCDPALERYRFVDKCERPAALGYCGISLESLGELAPRVEQRDGAWSIGRTHDEGAYRQRGVTAADWKRLVQP